MNAPSKPGFYWAKLVNPFRMPEGEDWVSVDWGVVEVWDNNGWGDEALAVSVPGVPMTQWLNCFEWGPEVAPMDMDRDEHHRVNGREEGKKIAFQLLTGESDPQAQAKVLLNEAVRLGGLSPVINHLIDDCHSASIVAGWYHDPVTGELLERNIPEMMCLIHSEISEAMEAYRKDLMDDKLPEFHGTTVELVDGLIRIFDLLGYVKRRLAPKYAPHMLDGGVAYVEKRHFNDHRADHKPENRAKAGGKSF